MKHIQTLAQLKAEKRKLQIQREASKQLLQESLRHTRQSAFHFIRSKVLLPAGITGAAAWGAGKLLFSSNGENGQEAPIQNGHERSHRWGDLLQQLLPIGIQLLSVVIKNELAEEEEVE